MRDEPETRSALSIGMEWSSRITTIGLEFALPACLGFGLDRWWNTSPWLTVTGSILGLLVGMTHVLRLATTLPGGTRGTGRRFRRGSAEPRDHQDSG